MTILGKINGLDLFLTTSGNLLIRFLSPIGWKEAIVQNCGKPNTVSLPYKDSAKPVWYVKVDKIKVALC